MAQRSGPLSRRLAQIYHNPASPGGFRGPEALWQEAKQHIPLLKKGQVHGFLRAQKPYSKHKQFTPVKNYRKVWSKRARYLIQMDLLDFRKWSNENDGHNYICCAIDVFTKKLWTFPLKTKTANELHDKLFYFIIRERPEKIQTDQGTEFFNRRFQNFLATLNPPIPLYNTWSIKKASVVERVQRTLRNRLGKIWEKNGNHRWINVLADITESYNNSTHRSIGMKPNDVGPQHHQLIYDRLYSTPPEKRRKEDALTRRRLKQLKVGDYVRLSEYRTKFRKESDLAWTHEVFRIKEVLLTEPLTFKVEDLSGDVIKGAFYFEELIKVKPDQAELVPTQRTDTYLTARRNQEIHDLDTVREAWEDRIRRRYNLRSRQT